MSGLAGRWNIWTWREVWWMSTQWGRWAKQGKRWASCFLSKDTFNLLAWESVENNYYPPEQVKSFIFWACWWYILQYLLWFGLRFAFSAYFPLSLFQLFKNVSVFLPKLANFRLLVWAVFLSCRLCSCSISIIALTENTSETSPFFFIGHFLVFWRMWTKRCHSTTS